MSEYWFKRRRYGWGWYPVTPAGWLTTGVGAGGILVGAMMQAPVGILISGFSALLLVLIAALKGPNPRWRWGVKSTDNPEEDA